MKLMGRLLFALICITTSGYLYAQDKIGEICKWDFDKDCAVALTFDDWLTTHPTIVVPALQERGMTATFYVITKDLNQNTIKQINSAAELGNEIGNHTITHPSSDVNIAKEARPAKEQLDAALVSQQAVTFDYPYGAFSNETIDSVRNSEHIAARGVWPPSNYRYNFAPNDNEYYNLRTVSVGGDGVNTTNDFANHLTKVVNGGGFITYLYHGVGKSGDYANIHKDSLYAQLDTLKSLSDKIWITTVAEAIKYHREARCASLSGIEIGNVNPDIYIIALIDTLPDNVYNQPLTVKVYNQGETFCEVKQGDDICPILYQTNEYVMFRAIPDGGNISLKRGHWDINSVQNIDNIATISVKHKTIFVTTDTHASVVFYTHTGKILSKQTGTCNFSVTKSGSYIVTVNGLSKTIVIN